MSLDDRLRRAADESAQLFDDIEVPRLPPARGHRPRAAAVVTVILGTFLVTAVVLRSSPGSELGTVVSESSTTARSASFTTTSSRTSTTAATSESAEVPVGPEPVPLDVRQPVPLRLFTIYGFDRNVEDVAVIDLEAATSTVYPEGEADVSGLLNGAAMTSRRDLVVWTYDQGASVFSGGLSVADLKLDPERPPIAGIALPGPEIVPTPSGGALWVVQPGVAYGEVDFDTIVELVELPTGRILASFTVEPNSHPVGATTAGLVLNTERFVLTGTGVSAAWTTEPGSEQVVLVDEDGTANVLGPGWALAAAANTIVRRVCTPGQPETCDLLVGDAVGSLAGPGNGAWSPVEGPSIPNPAMPLRPISTDGKSMLVAFGENPDPNGNPAQSVLYAVDLETGESRTIATFDDGYPTATWSADGRWIAVINGRDITLYAGNDPALSFTIENAIPRDHYPLAAG